jgi:oligopeptide/dipeptide ABC transporter ATP-binding protein
LTDPVLSVRDLRVSFRTEDEVVRAVRGVNFDLAPSEILGLVGESGCGKSTVAMALTALNRSHNGTLEGDVMFGGRNLLSLSTAQLRGVRGAEIAMIFQDPMTSLTPVHRVGSLITEVLRSHEPISRAAARDRAIELLGEVGIPDPAHRINDFPHEFSGGMRQRVMIAMALALEPEVLIADEPTTALDVTIQAQIMALIEKLNADRGLAVVLITHDLGVVAEAADRVVVMYAGQIVEDASLDDIFYNPQHPYTWGLLGSLSRLDQPRPHRLPQISGAPPSLLDLPEGCSFRPRCPHEFGRCTEVPALEARLADAPSHCDRCWLTPEQKREKRQVAGQIGLEAPV